MLPYALIALFSSAATIVLAFITKLPNYRVAPTFLIPLIILPLFFRRKLHLTPFLYLLYALALNVHDLGAFGLYQKSVLGLSFDHYVHFYFAVAGSAILYNALEKSFPLGRWQLRITTLLFTMGIGALHEIMEYCSFVLLGEERGMLKPHSSSFFDTQLDLLNNLLGVLTTLLFLFIYHQLSRRPLRPMHQH